MLIEAVNVSDNVRNVRSYFWKVLSILCSDSLWLDWYDAVPVPRSDGVRLDVILERLGRRDPFALTVISVGDVSESAVRKWRGFLETAAVQSAVLHVYQDEMEEINWQFVEVFHDFSGREVADTVVRINDRPVDELPEWISWKTQRETRDRAD